jgi:hypothetical protein
VKRRVSCEHFVEEGCSLVERITRLDEGSEFGLPRCGIRHRCRWWRQEGPAACKRCPMIVTRAFGAASAIQAAASPPVTALTYSHGSGGQADGER